MDTNQNRLDELNKEIDLSAIYREVKNKKWLIIFVFIISFLGSYLLGKIFIKDLYQSNAVLKPLSQEKPQTSDILNQIGNISSLASASSFLDGASEHQEIIEISLSKNFVKILIDKNDFTQNIIAAKDYKFETNEIIYDKNLFDDSESKWVRKKKKLKDKVPSYVEVHKKYIEDIFTVSSDEDNFITMTTTHFSPYYAKELLDLILYELDNLIRTRDLLKTNEYINFLNSELQKNPSIEISSAISDLIAVNMKTKMLASFEKDYSFRVIDSPFIAIKKSYPSRILYSLLFSALITFLLICLIIKRNSSELIYEKK